jgi:hypothetical protein
MKRTVIICLFLFFWSVCSEAQVSTILKDKRFFEGPLEKIAVITQVPDTGFRKQLDDALAAAFNNKKISFVNAHDLFPPDTLIFYSTLEREFYEAGTDGVLIVKLIDVGLSDMYIIPGGVLPPDAYNYYEFYSVYYYYDLPLIGVPGYLERKDRTFRLDANLYQGKGDMILWAGQSKNIDMADYEDDLKTFAKKLAKTLRSEKLLQK